MTEIPTGPNGRGTKLYLATVIDLYSRRLLGAATGLHPDAQLAADAITMAVTARGGAEQVSGVIFHTDGGSTYTTTPPEEELQPATLAVRVDSDRAASSAASSRPAPGRPCPTHQTSASESSIHDVRPRREIASVS